MECLILEHIKHLAIPLFVTSFLLVSHTCTQYIYIFIVTNFRYQLIIRKIYLTMWIIKTGFSVPSMGSKSKTINLIPISIRPVIAS